MHALPQADEDLLARTYALLVVVKPSYNDIAEGAGVDKNWVAKFVTQKIGDPGSKKVQKVHNFLMSRATPEQIAQCGDPNHSQSLGSAGNG